MPEETCRFRRRVEDVVIILPKFNVVAVLAAVRNAGERHGERDNFTQWLQLRDLG